MHYSGPPIISGIVPSGLPRFSWGQLEGGGVRGLGIKVFAFHASFFSLVDLVPTLRIVSHFGPPLHFTNHLFTQPRVEIIPVNP